VHQAFDRAEYVFIGHLVSYEQYRERDPTGKVTMALSERARLKITHVWKGSKKVSDEFLVETRYLYSGNCGASIVNSPVWLEEKAEDGTTRPVKFTGTWLIYADAEPYHLDWCSRSTPYSLIEEDVKYLDEITGQSKDRFSKPFQPSARERTPTER
jgi:hypothetical protein